MNGFRVPNALLRMGIKHTPLMVCLYLLSRQFPGKQEVDATIGQIAERIRKSPRTVSSALRDLEKTGLISKRNLIRDGRIVALLLMPPSFPGRWVWVDKRIFDLPLTAGETSVYLYLLSRANQAGRCFPSLSLFEANTGLVRNKILRAVRTLCSMVLLQRIHYRRDDNSFGNNNYIVATCRQRDGLMIRFRKKKARTTVRRYRAQRNNFTKIQYHFSEVKASHGVSSRDILQI